MDALKVREKILFHDHLLLFTDDFSDNGAVVLDVKVVSRYPPCMSPP